MIMTAMVWFTLVKEVIKTLHLSERQIPFLMTKLNYWQRFLQIITNEVVGWWAMLFLSFSSQSLKNQNAL